MNQKTSGVLRRKVAAFIVGGGLLIGGVLGAASLSNNGAGTATASPSLAGGVQQAPASGAASVPKPLENAGHYGENVYDAVKLGDWKKANTELASLKSATAQLRGSGGGNTARLGADVGALEKAVTAKDRQAALLSSNKVTLDAANLSASYNTPVPVEVTKLDYYGRQLEIQAAAGDRTALKQTAADIQNTWSSVRPQVVANGGAVEAKQFDATVAKVQQAGSPARYGQLSKDVLAQVDYLEKVFG